MQKLVLLKPYFMVFSFLLLFTLPATAQGNDDDIRKAALIVKIAQELAWPVGEVGEQFVFTVYDAPEIYATLNSVSDINIGGKPAVFNQSQNEAELKNANLVYVDRPSNELHARLFSTLQDSGTLLVTSDSAEIVSSMINLYTMGEVLGFSVNRPNLESAGFGISPRLLELGGSEIESTEIYKEVIKSVTRSRSAYQRLQKAMVAATKRFEEEKAEQDRQLNNLKSEIDSQKQQLSQAQSELNKKQSEISDQTQRLDQIRRSLQTSEAQIEAAEAALLEKQEQVKTSGEQLRQLSSEIALQQAKLNEQQTTLTQQRTALSEQQMTLNEKEGELSLKDELLEAQVERFNIMVVFIGIIVIAMFVVVRLWTKNRRANAELSKSLHNLEKAKNQLVESEKFAALGQLVAGVAHELNTPIGVSITSSSAMKSTVQNLEEEIASGKVKKSSLLKHLETIKTAQELTLRNLSRAGNLIQSFKLVSADQSMSGQRETDLLSYLEEILQTLDVTLKSNNIAWELKGDRVALDIDPGQFAQIVQNLVINCQRHAFKDIEDPKITITLSCDDSGIFLTIRDNGVGMEKSVKDKIFEPFYTTARVSGGTGLGMHIVYNLVTQSFHGSVSVESQPGKGCAFLISLPRVISVEK